MTSDVLAEVTLPNAPLRQIEPDIFSVLANDGEANAYDAGFGRIYDLVACNPMYNRLIWGYSVGHFAALTEAALAASPKGRLLDLGCGSLAFTAGVYMKQPHRHIVFVDQSIRMLRLAKTRMLKLHGSIPKHMVFLRANALDLPFRTRSFDAVLSLNLLHCLSDIPSFVLGLQKIVSAHGKMYFTTLVEADRLADRYLATLADSGKLVSRNVDDLQTSFRSAGLKCAFTVTGNLASVTC